MVQVSSRILAPDGHPLYNIRVAVYLTDINGRQVAGWVGDEQIASKAFDSTNRDGYWQIDLTPNDLIIPADTVYTIVQYIDEERTSYKFIVPNQAGPIEAQDWQVEGELDPLGSSALQAHIANEIIHSSGASHPDEDHADTFSPLDHQHAGMESTANKNVAGGYAGLDTETKLSHAVIPAYEHIQDAPAAVWTVQHNMGRWPNSVLVFDSFNEKIVTELDFPDANTVVATFAGVATGRIRIS